MKKIIVINHKSKIPLNNIKKYILDLNEIVRKDKINIVCPSNIYLPYLNGKYNFKVGAQNVVEKQITGEITGEILKGNGVSYVLIGHPDRLNNLNESAEMINSKIKESIKNNITPIIILGETYYNSKLRKTGEVITKQIKEYIKNIEIDKDIIFAYIPNWELKDNQIPKIEYIKEVVDLIKTNIKRTCNANIKVLYGGNVNKTTIEYLEKIPNIDGYIIEEISENLNEIKNIFNIIE